MEVWTKYKVKGKFLDKVFGGIPSDPEVVEGFISTKKGLSKEEKESAKDIIKKSQELNTVCGAISKMSNIFNVDETGIYLNNYQFMAALKEAMSIQKSITSWRSKMQRGVRVMPVRVYLIRDGKHITNPDGFEQRVVHSEVMGSPVTSLKRIAFINEPEFEFEVWSANDKESAVLSHKALSNLLEQIEVTGIGSMHSMGMGMCELKLAEEAKAKKPEPKAMAQEATA